MFIIITMLLLCAHLVIFLTDAFRALATDGASLQGEEGQVSPPAEASTSANLSSSSDPVTDQVVPPSPASSSSSSQQEPIDLTTTRREEEPLPSSAQPPEPSPSSAQPPAPCPTCSEERRRGGLRVFSLGRLFSVSKKLLEFCFL